MEKVTVKMRATVDNGDGKEYERGGVYTVDAETAELWIFTARVATEYVEPPKPVKVKGGKQDASKNNNHE